MLIILGSISNIDDDANYRCTDGSSPDKVQNNKVISGVVAAASSVTSIQVANLLKLFKIPQVSHTKVFKITLLFTSYFTLFQCNKQQNTGDIL